MGIQFDNNALVSVSTLDVLETFIYSAFWGFWTLAKKVIKQLLYKKEELPIRGNPPACLTDNAIGQHSYIKLKGVKFHYVEAGDRCNPILLLLHGFPDCWITWRYQIPELSQYFRVIAVDLKGFGDSDKPEARNSYNVKKLIDELRDFVLSLGSDSCHIIGHDIGALLGWFLLHIYPGFVQKFVALATPHPNLYWDSIPTTSCFNKRWVQFCQLPYLPELQALEEDISVINKCYQHLETNSLNKYYLEAYKYAFSRKADWTGALNYFRNLPFWKLSCEEKSILSPCLLIVGNKDSSIQMESIIKSTDYIQKFSLKVVEGASHYLHQQRPNEVNKLITNFLIGEVVRQEVKVPQSNGLVNRMFGAVSSTVKNGYSVLGAVQKTTNGLTTRTLSFGQGYT